MNISAAIGSTFVRSVAPLALSSFVVGSSVGPGGYVRRIKAMINSNERFPRIRRDTFPRCGTRMPPPRSREVEEILR